MAMNHLDEDQLQELLDGNLSVERRERVRQHLAECPSCQERVGQYQALYRGLKDESEFVMPVGFAAEVAATAEAPEESSLWMSWPVLGGASLMAVIGTLVSIMGSEKLIALGQQLLLAQNNVREGFMAPIESLITATGYQGELIFFGVLALAMVAVLDRVVKSVKRGRAMLLM